MFRISNFCLISNRKVSRILNWFQRTVKLTEFFKRRVAAGSLNSQMTNFCHRQLFDIFAKKVNLTVVRQSSDTCQAIFKHSSGSRMVVVRILSDSRQAVLRQPLDSCQAVIMQMSNFLASLTLSWLFWQFSFMPTIM